MLSRHFRRGNAWCRWYVADGCLGRTPRPLDKSPELEKRLQSGEGASTSSQPGSIYEHTGEIERIFMLRGVVWGGEGVDTFKLWQDIMRFWPTPIAQDYTQPPGVLLAHAGDCSSPDASTEPAYASQVLLHACMASCFVQEPNLLSL